MYFPSFNETHIDCSQCEKENCPNRYRFQRNKRDFTFTSGRCPKLPDTRGFVQKEYQEAQRNAYPIIYAECGEDSVDLSISIPNKKGQFKVYLTKSGYWYYNKNGSGKQAISILGFKTREEILQRAEFIHADYLLLSCELMPFII